MIGRSTTCVSFRFFSFLDFAFFIIRVPEHLLICPGNSCTMFYYNVQFKSKALIIALQRDDVHIFFKCIQLAWKIYEYVAFALINAQYTWLVQSAWMIKMPTLNSFVYTRSRVCVFFCVDYSCFCCLCVNVNAKRVCVCLWICIQSAFHTWIFIFLLLFSVVIGW